METTKLIFEFLAGGTVISLSLLLLAGSVFPAEWQKWMAWLATPGTILEKSPVLVAAVATAIVYAVGIITEHLGEATFESWLDLLKEQRFRKYLHEHRQQLVCTPLRMYFIPNSEQDIKKNYKSAIGYMRFYVMAHNSALSDEISAQISRFRLVRVTFWAEWIIIAALVFQLVREPSGILWMGLGVVFFLLGFNIYTVYYRFGRYIRSIERAYLALTIDQVEERSQAQPMEMEIEVGE